MNLSAHQKISLSKAGFGFDGLFFSVDAISGTIEYIAFGGNLHRLTVSAGHNLVCHQRADAELGRILGERITHNLPQFAPDLYFTQPIIFSARRCAA